MCWREHNAKKEEVELARDMRDEYHHVLEELQLMNLPSITLQTRKKLFLLRQKVAVLLLAKVRIRKAENQQNHNQQ